MNFNYIFLAAAGLISIASAPPGLAQEMTVEDKFKALVDAGIFQSTSETPSSGELSRSDVADLIAKLMDLDAGPASSAQTFGDFSQGEWVAEYIEAETLSGYGHGVFDPNPDLSSDDLAEIMVDALGVEDGTLSALSDWTKMYVAQAVQGELINQVTQPSPGTRAALVQALGNAQGGGTGSTRPQPQPEPQPQPRPWSDYPFFAARDRTSSLPDEFLNSKVNATYNGVVSGNVADGDPLTGTSFFDVVVDHGDVSLHGNFTFDTGEEVELYGSEFSEYLSVYPNLSEFRGGMLSHGGLDASFYGPEAQEVAGSWRLLIVGGTDPGLATGQFAAKR
jgi:hypothetical protein